MKKVSILKSVGLILFTCGMANSLSGMGTIGDLIDKDIGIRVQKAHQTINAININIEQLKQQDKPLKTVSAIEWLDQIDNANEQLFTGFPLNEVQKLFERLNLNKRMEVKSHVNQQVEGSVAALTSFSLPTPKTYMLAFYEDIFKIGKKAPAKERTIERQLDQNFKALLRHMDKF